MCVSKVKMSAGVIASKVKQNRALQSAAAAKRKSSLEGGAGAAGGEADAASLHARRLREAHFRHIQHQVDTFVCVNKGGHVEVLCITYTWGCCATSAVGVPYLT